MKRIKIIALMLAVVMAFTGCMKMDANMVINADGSGVMTSTVDIDKQACIKGMEDMMGVAVTDAEIAEMDKSMASEGYAIVNVDGKEYYRMTSTENVKAGELSKQFAGDDTTSYITADTLYVDLATSDTMANQDMGMDMSGMDMSGLDMSGMSMKLTFEFSAPIVSTNGVIDAANPNKVTYDIPMTVAKYTMFATTKPGVTVDAVKAEVKKLNEVKAPKIRKLKVDKTKKKSKKATATLKFKKVKGSEMYEIQYGLKKNFKNAKICLTNKTTYKLKNLKKGKKYYVRVRARKENYAGQEVYSKWTKKTLKVKK